MSSPSSKERRRRERAWALLVLLTVLVMACQVVVGLDRPDLTEPTPPPPSPLPPEAGPVDAGPFLCKRGVPEPPSADDQARPGAPIAAEHYDCAARFYTLRGAGVDMDCVSSVCEENRPPKDVICTSGDPYAGCDGDGGVDNRGGELVVAYRLAGLDEEISQARITTGEYTELVRVDGYNGLPNDTSVQVTLIPSHGFYQHIPPDPNSGCPGIPGPNVSDGGPDGGWPRWDGCDKWSRDIEVVSSDLALKGFVRDSVLYVPPSFSKASVRLTTAKATFDTIGFRADIERVAASGAPAARDEPAAFLRLNNAVVSGRISVEDILRLMTRLRPKDDCFSFVELEGARKNICRQRDLPKTEQSVGRACDALSFAIRFNAEPVVQGPSEEPPNIEPCIVGAPPEIATEAGAVIDASFLSCE